MILDIETKADVDRTLRLLGPFDPASVKLGNLKDQAKIDEKIEEARANHAKNAVEKAALSAITGSVCAIGVLREGVPTIFDGDLSEEMALREFWQLYAETDHDEKIVFWDGSGQRQSNFDVDFLWQRSIILGVSVPLGVRQTSYNNFSSRFFNLATYFLLGKYDAFLSLTNACELLGLYGQAVEVGGGEKRFLNRKQKGQGKDFAKLWSNPETRDEAMNYLYNDLYSTAALAERIGP